MRRKNPKNNWWNNKATVEGKVAAWKDVLGAWSENLYNEDKEEQIMISICGFDGD